jgi:hypothetical protein
MICFWGSNVIPKSGLAQDSPTSIDEVFIERQPTNKTADKNLPPDTYSIGDEEIIDDDLIVFDIPGINQYISEKHISLSDIVLKIDTLELNELPAFIENSESGVIRFLFDKNSLSNKNRAALYKLPGKEIKKARIGIKINDSTVVYWGVTARLSFPEVKNWGKLGWLLIIAFFVLFIAAILYKNGALLTDNIKNMPYENDADLKNIADKSMIKANGKKNSPKTYFSFSKTQFAFWTLIVLISFIYIWAMTGDLNSINATGLILLGITSATIGLGNLIDVSDLNKAVQADKANQNNKTSVSNDKANPSNKSASNDNVKNLFSNRIPDPEKGESRHFLLDILSDKDGISMHRLQALVFNFVFGLAFLLSVWRDYTMPVFSDIQLVLLGLSSGTYACIKTTENKTS